MNLKISILFSFIFFLLTSCSSYNMPGRGVENMSGDTLCYRSAYARPDPAIIAEIAARHLDCTKILEEQGTDAGF